MNFNRKSLVAVSIVFASMGACADQGTQTVSVQNLSAIPVMSVDTLQGVANLRWNLRHRSIDMSSRPTMLAKPEKKKAKNEVAQAEQVQADEGGSE